jgi:hypothetical protein
VVWQGEVQLEFVNQKIGDPGHLYHLAVQPAVRSAPVQASELAGFTAAFAIKWPDGQRANVKARLDHSGDFTATVPVPADANGPAHVMATAQAAAVHGQAVTVFNVTPGGGLTVNLNVPPGTRVSPGGTVTANGTIDTNGAPATSIVFALGDLHNGVEAALVSPRGLLKVGSGNQPVKVVIKFFKGTRLGPVLGTIKWAPTATGTAAPSDYLAADSLDVTIGYPPKPLTAQWWFWVGLAALLGALLGAGAWLLRRWLQNRAEMSAYGPVEFPKGPAPRPYQTAASTAPWKPSERFKPPEKPPAGGNGSGSASDAKRGARFGRRK